MYGVETTINSKDRHRFYCLNYSVVVYYHLFGESLSFYDSEVNQPVAFLNEVEMQLLVCLNVSQTVCHTTMYRWYSINSLTVYEPQKSLLCIENLR